MSAIAPPVRARVRARLDAIPHATTALGLGAIMLASLWLRTRAIDAKFWIDEGLSVGIAHHGLFDIPSVLRQDGSPPLYYMVLKLWMIAVGGDGETRTHALSVLCSVLCIPASFVLSRRIFGARSAWAAAALVATLPFLTYYAQETRMYALVALLSVIASGTYALAFALRERWAIPVFAISTALLFYAHNWGLFLGLGFFTGFVVLLRTVPAQERRPLVRDGLLGFGGVGLLYLPWVPTLLGQASDTGAPWADRPNVESLITNFPALLGGSETTLLVLLLAGGGLFTLREGLEGRPRLRAALILAVALGVGVLVAWLQGVATRGFTTRYFSAFIGPALLLAGAGLVRYGKVGLIALAIVLVLWFDPGVSGIRGKSDVYRVAKLLKHESLVLPNDLIVTTQPEQTPLLYYYFGPDYRYADALGRVPDTQVFDWRNAPARLKATYPKPTLNRLARMVRPGQHLVLMVPILRSAAWDAPWTSLVKKRTLRWEQVVAADPRFQHVARVPNFSGRRHVPRGMRAIVFLRR